MDEVIYKNDAIEAIRNVANGGSAMRKVLFIKALENVPPAQPEYSKLAIDAGALMDAFYKTPQDMRTWSRAWALINRAKLVQPERKKGRWLLDEEGGTCYCSECKEENYYAYDWNIKRYTDKFCPNCGAQMIQEGENNDE